MTAALTGSSKKIDWASTWCTSKRNGTGLGLALVQKIIVFHNGRIAAGSSPLGGASLQVSLPVS